VRNRTILLIALIDHFCFCLNKKNLSCDVAFLFFPLVQTDRSIIIIEFSSFFVREYENFEESYRKTKNPTSQARHSSLKKKKNDRPMTII